MATVKDLKWGIDASFSFTTDAIIYYKKQKVFIVYGSIIKFNDDYDYYQSYVEIVTRAEAERRFKEIMEAPRKPLVEDLEDMLPF